MSEPIQGELAVVAKTAGIKLKVAGTETGWINPTKEAKESILPTIDELKKKVGKQVEITRTEDTVYSAIKILDDTEEPKEEVIKDNESAPKKPTPAPAPKPAPTPAPKQPEQLGETASGVPTGASHVPEKAEADEEDMIQAITQATEQAMISMVAAGQKKDPEYFKKLAKVKCDIKKLNIAGTSLNYTSWAEAWGKLKEHHSDATYHIYENRQGMPYFADTSGAFVKVSVTVAGITHTVHLPVMDNRNKSVPKAQLDTFTINKNIQRAFTKAISMHGIGLYVYQGEDLPEGDQK